MQRCLWMLVAVLACVSGEYLMGGHLDNNAEAKSRSGKIESLSTLGHKTHLDDLDLDLMAEESTAGATTSSTLTDDDVPRYHIPYPFAFNGGKPFSLEKDPITGKIDFEKAPPLKALNYTDRYQEYENKENEDDSEDADNQRDAYLQQEKVKSKDNDDVSPNEINTYTPNFHDFLNLPIHYSSDKYGNDKYPLISSSYANTKVQSGANSYSTYNHRPYHPENDLYSIKNSYASMTRPSTQKITNYDFQAKWTSATSSSPVTTFTSPPTTSSPKIMFSTSTKVTNTPVITTWKPPISIVSIISHSANSTIAREENEKHTLPIEKLQASNFEVHQKPNIPTQSTSDKATEKAQTITRYKDQPNLNNFVLSQVGAEMKLSTQNEEYGDSYDIYESADSEGEGEGEGDSDGDGNNDNDNGDSHIEENDYFLPFLESSRENVTSIPSIASSNVTTSTANTTTSAAASSVEIASAATTIPSSRPTLLIHQEDVANNPAQILMKPQQSIFSSLNSDVRQSVTERYNGIKNHGYRPAQETIKKQNKVGGGIVIESTSNIVIPPDQDTVSFVLGNRQNVDGDYYSVGTAIGENPYGSLPDVDTSFWPLHDNPYSPTKEIKHEDPAVPLRKWWPPSSSTTKNNEIEPTRPQNAFIPPSDATTEDAKNRNKEKTSNYVAFPGVEVKDQDGMTKEYVVIVNETDGNIHELPPKTPTATTVKTIAMMMTNTTNNTKINFPTVSNTNGDLPQLAENLMPPAQSPRPPLYYYHYQHDTLRTDHSRPQRLPLVQRVKPHSGPSIPPLEVGLRRRPYSPDTKLPNILPQFRPNAKASHGHRFGSDAIGTMSAGQSAPTRIRQPLKSHPSLRRPLPPPPFSYFQPPPPPIHAIRLAFVPTSKLDSAPIHETEPTIQRLRPPHVPTSVSREGQEENAPSNRLFDHAAGPSEGDSENRKQDRGKSEVEIGENESSERYPEEPPILPPKPPLFPKLRTADPPHVTTLQMIQHHGELAENEAQSVQPVEPMLAHQAERRKLDNHPSESVEQPIYVVYPVNTAVNIHPDDSKDEDGSVVVGTRGPHRPLPPDTLLQDEREKVHTVYNSRPVALDFPYPLERPDPSSVFSVAAVKETPLLIPSDQRQQPSFASEREKDENEQDVINVIPYLQDFSPYQKKNDAAISVTLHRAAPTSLPTSTLSTSISTPIAYVYTPTHAAAHHLDDDTNGNSDATILLPSQQPSSSSSSAPAPQNFMAPFVASMSAEAPSKNGWNVVVIEPSPGADRRLDSGDGDDANSEAVDTQTEKIEFDADNFKPQLFGGFKPIYEFPTEDMQHRDVADTNNETDMSKRSKELPVPENQ